MNTWADLPAPLPAYNEEKDTVVRQSTINSLQLCGQRVALETQPGFLPAVSEPLAFGTLVHFLIAEHLVSNETQIGRLLNMPEWVEPILNEEYDWTLGQVDSVNDFFTEIGVAYRSWVTTVLPRLTGEIITVEEQMSMVLGPGTNGGNILLQGTADLTTSSTLIDWKTSKRPWKDSKAQFAIQPTLYPALVKQTKGDSPRKFIFWIYARSEAEWQKLTTERRVREINAGLATAYQYGLQLEAGALPATPLSDNFGNIKRGWWCSTQYCSAWNICDYKYLPDDIDESEIAERTW